MKIQTDTGLTKVLAHLENAEPEQALQILGTLFQYDFGREDLVLSAEYCNFWVPYIRQLANMENPFERGESLIIAWKQFRQFVLRKAKCYERAIYSVNKGIFSKALENFSQVLDEKDNMHKAEVYRRLGLCYKKLGKFENAVHSLSIANNAQVSSAATLAELADCYALCGNDKNAKVLFREAFFIAPEKIDITVLDSELITSLIQKTEEKGFTGSTLLNWIPVYGIIWGVFNIKRELSGTEASKLKQEIYALENEMKNPSCDSHILTPRLINLYFWLIDHYIMSNASVKLVNDVLLKIKILDSAIHEMYIKGSV